MALCSRSLGEEGPCWLCSVPRKCCVLVPRRSHMCLGLWLSYSRAPEPPVRVKGDGQLLVCWGSGAPAQEPPEGGCSRGPAVTQVLCLVGQEEPSLPPPALSCTTVHSLTQGMAGGRAGPLQPPGALRPPPRDLVVWRTLHLTCAEGHGGFSPKTKLE